MKFILKHIKQILFILIIIIIFSGFSFTYFFEEKSYEETEFLLNTIISIKAYGKDAKVAVNASFDRIKVIDSEMNTHSPNSAISYINDNAFNKPINISSDIYYVIDKSLDFSNSTEGFFDISIKPISDLWQIGTENARVPKKEEINEALNYVDFNNIKLLDNTITFLSKDTQIDLGGIAKGYAADEVYNIMEKYNITRAYGNLGGNVLVYGEKKLNILQKFSKEKEELQMWKIGIQDPLDTRGSHIAVVSVKNTSVVTSGAYERYFEQDGIIYHHILNPFTGYPVESDLLSTTIICPSSINADALSTSTFILGSKKAQVLINSTPNTDAIFVTKSNEVIATEGIRNRVLITNNNYTLLK